MTNQEFSNQFDLLYNNIMSNQAPGLDEYEKSVFLTKAQDEVLKAYVNPKSNKVQEGYDDSQKRQVDFSTITVSKTLDSVSEDYKIIDKDTSGCYLFPNNALFILNEILKVDNEGSILNLQILPITFEQFTEKMTKPFAYPTKRAAWRVITNQSVYNGTVSQVFWHLNETPIKYTVRFIKKPHPIILQDLGSDLSIEGYSYRSGSVHITSINPNYTGSTQDKYSVTKLNALRKEGYTFEQIDDKLLGIIRGLEVAEKKFWLVSDTTFPSSTDVDILYQYKGMFDYQGDFNTTTGLLETKDCELPEELHEEILQRAIELAKAAYSGSLGDATAIGNVSSTQLGIVSSK